MTTPEERFTFDAGRREVSGVYARPVAGASTLVVAHGAGAGMDHPFLVGFARAMNAEDVATLRFNFPYMESERRSPDTQEVAIAAWTAAFDEAVRRADGAAVFAGGKSYGGRMASMAAAEGMAAIGLVFLGYPLHPPGKSERIRDEHLSEIRAPMLFLHGTGDPFARPDILAAVIAKLGARATYHAVEGGDHSFNVRGRKLDAREVGAELAPVTAAWMKKVT